jgi:hypothetical protein
MSGSVVQWLIVLAFFAGFFVITFAEARWLSKKTAMPMQRAFAVAFVPNIFTITVGFFVSAAIFGVILLFVWDRTLQTTESETTVYTAIALAFVAPLLILFAAKRFALRIMRIDGITNPWAYSLVASLLFFAAVLALPAAITVLF